MSSTVVEQVLFRADASAIAFHAGQHFEELLLERAVQAALQADSSVVTVEHVLSCLDGGLFERLKQFLDERSKQQPRKAA